MLQGDLGVVLILFLFFLYLTHGDLGAILTRFLLLYLPQGDLAAEVLFLLQGDLGDDCSVFVTPPDCAASITG